MDTAHTDNNSINRGIYTNKSFNCIYLFAAEIMFCNQISPGCPRLTYPSAWERGYHVTKSKGKSVSKYGMAESHWMPYLVTHTTVVSSVYTCGDAYHLHKNANISWIWGVAYACEVRCTVCKQMIYIHIIYWKDSPGYTYRWWYCLLSFYQWPAYKTRVSCQMGPVCHALACRAGRHFGRIPSKWTTYD